MKQVTLHHRTYNVAPQLAEFNVSAPQSNSIAFYGSNPDNGSMFFQFASGGTYIFYGITPQIRKELFNAKSIGSYVSKNIVKKFTSQKLEGKGVFLS